GAGPRAPGADRARAARGRVLVLLPDRRRRDAPAAVAHGGVPVRHRVAGRDAGAADLVAAPCADDVLRSVASGVGDADRVGGDSRGLAAALGHRTGVRDALDLALVPRRAGSVLGRA